MVEALAGGRKGDGVEVGDVVSIGAGIGRGPCDRVGALDGGVVSGIIDVLLVGDVNSIEEVGNGVGSVDGRAVALVVRAPAGW